MKWSFLFLLWGYFYQEQTLIHDVQNTHTGSIKTHKLNVLLSQTMNQHIPLCTCLSCHNISLISVIIIFLFPSWLPYLQVLIFSSLCVSDHLRLVTSLVTYLQLRNRRVSALWQISECMGRSESKKVTKTVTKQWRDNTRDWTWLTGIMLIAC